MHWYTDAALTTDANPTILSKIRYNAQLSSGAYDSASRLATEIFLKTETFNKVRGVAASHK